MKEAPSKEVTPVTETPLTELTTAGTAPVFEAVKAVTRPVLRFGAQPEYVRIEGPMYQGEKIEKAKYENVPTLLDVINLRTGEAMMMVCASVFISEMDRAYPDASYVGKDFQVRKINTDGKKYAIWSITEIRLK
jgi:hypothetical protein